MTATGEQTQWPDVVPSREIFALLDAHWRPRHVSEHTSLGVTDRTTPGASGTETIHPTDVEVARRLLQAAREHPGVPVNGRLRSRVDAGPWRELEVSIVNRLGEAGVDAYVVTGTDVTTERRAAVAGCLETRLLDSLPTALVVTDDAGVIVLWNRRATELYGYAAEEALGHDLDTLAMAAPPEVQAESRARIAVDGCWSGEFVAVRKDGTAIPVLSTLEEIDAPEIGFRGVVSATIDNSERRALQVTLAHRALHDPLTGLPNRALFIDRLDLALARLRRQSGMLAVLFLDLDRFKLVNDSCGHQAGDEVLRAVAALFEGVLRATETVARIGGDEFAVCCEQLWDPADAMALAQRLTTVVSRPFMVDGREFYVTPSIGVVLGTGAPGETASTLLRDADAAMYRAKERGRGRIELFDQGLRLDVLRRAETTSDLRHAINRGELALQYQPVVRVADGTLAGFEALLRWHHPKRGILLPAEFMDVAEDSNLIVPIGAWVLDEAARQAAIWREERPEHPITMSVNLSPRQIAHAQLVPTVRDVLVRHGLDPSQLSLEITESTLMEDAASSVTTLRQLKALGVQLAIDDFGTGYSSLAYLKRFPVDFLKIDRSFVDGIEHESEDAVIVKAIVQLGRALGLGVVAEGVETDGQLAALEALGCELAQGYRWSRPRPPADAALVSSEWRPWKLTESITPGVVATEDPALLSTAELLAVVTHELVTPLTLVRGQCERLVDAVGSVPGASDLVAEVMRNAERIEHLVVTLADAQQLDAGTMSLELGQLDLVDLVRGVVDLAVPTEREVRLGGASQVLLALDGPRVEQIMLNLLGNAHKFSPSGTPIDVIVEANEDEATVIVADLGPGVPAERVGDIFRKFARLERTKKGLGLGLFISRRLARAHGGDLHYRRRRPAGSELVLTLPRHAEVGTGGGAHVIAAGAPAGA